MTYIKRDIQGFEIFEVTRSIWGGEVPIQLTVTDPNGVDGAVCVNISADEAKALRKALKAAITDVEGKN